MTLKLGNVPTLFNIAAFHAERSIDQVQTWARELQSSIGSAFRQLEASAKAIEDALAATQATAEANAAMVPLLVGGFVLSPSGFIRRWTRGANGLLASSAASGIALATDLTIDLTAQGVTLAGDVRDHAVVIGDATNLVDIRFIERIDVRTSTLITLRARRPSTNAFESLPSAFVSGTGASFAVFGKKTP